MEEQGEEVSTIAPATEKAFAMRTSGGSSEPRAKKQTTRAGASLPIITTIYMFADVVPSDGALTNLTSSPPLQ